MKIIQTGADPDFIPEWDESGVNGSDEDVVISHNWDELRRFMWDYVGIFVPTNDFKERNIEISLLQSTKSSITVTSCRISRDLLELRNLATVSELIIRCALQRKESKGLHYTLDTPNYQT